MEVFYFLFLDTNEFQQVVASRKEQAMREIEQMHDSGWDICCTQEELNQAVEEQLFQTLTPLPPIYANTMFLW